MTPRDGTDGRPPPGGRGTGEAPAAGEEARARPLGWTARLARDLRREGIACALPESLAALDALDHLDLSDGLDAYFGLRAVFVSDPVELSVFDRVFWGHWGRRQNRSAEDAGAPSGEPAGSRDGARQRPPGDETAGRSVIERLRRGGVPGEGEVDPEDRAGAGYSAAETLAGRSFASLDEGEMREVRRTMDRLKIRLSTRKSRRREPHPRQGRIDVRRSFRGALGTDGELLRLVRRRRRIERPRVVLLCDVSGSMERYSRFLIRFLLSAGRDRDVETFVFSTRLVRLTGALVGARPDEALDALSERVPGWSGGTRIGECLEEFLDRHGRSLLGQRSVVVVLSDGLDRGEVDRLERAMRGIRRKSRKVIWLNPLLESPDYRPEARGMKAALPHVDEFAPGHSLEALRELTRLVRL